MRERLSSVPQIQEALAKAEATAATATQCLAGQREEASRLRTQVEAAAAAADQLQQRTRELTSLEQALRSQLANRERSLTEQRELVGRLGAELEGALTAGSELKAQVSVLDKDRCDLQAEVSTLKSLTTELQTTLNGERAKAQEKLDLLLGASEDLLTQFKALSSDIMEEKGRKFSPSTLLFVVRTVAYLWRQETQARNVIEIAKRGAALYDKLCGFVEDLDDVGKHIQRTGKAYDAALRKLAVGDGNVIRQAEMLRDLGVKPTKQLPIQLVDRAMSKVQHSLLKEDDGTTKDEEVSAGSAIVG